MPSSDRFHRTGKEQKALELDLENPEHLPYDELLMSIVKAGSTCMRPVLLTAITTVLGLIPLAMGININFFTLLSDFDPAVLCGRRQCDVLGPLAWTVIFGLTFATFSPWSLYRSLTCSLIVSRCGYCVPPAVCPKSRSPPVGALDADSL